MSTLQEIQYKVIAAMEGGTETSESKFLPGFINSAIDAARASIASDLYAIDKNQSELWMLPYKMVYEAMLQSQDCFDNNYRVFRIPEYINLGATRDGLDYVGSPNRLSPLERLGYGNMAPVYAQHPRSNQKKNRGWTSQRDDNGNVTVKIYNSPSVENIIAIGNWRHPSELPNYRVDVDTYPIPGDKENDIIAKAVSILRLSMASPADILPNGQDDSNLMRQK